MALTKGAASLIALNIGQILIGIILTLQAISYLNNQAFQRGYITYVPPPQLIVTVGIIAIITAILGFCFGVKPKKDAFSLYLCLALATFVVSLVYLVWALPYFFAYEGFLLIIISAVGFSLSINVKKNANNDEGGYQRYVHPNVNRPQQHQPPVTQPYRLVQGVFVDLNQQRSVLQYQQQENYYLPPNKQPQQYAQHQVASQIQIKNSTHANLSTKQDA